MITFLRGTILQKSNNFVIVETGNVGYQVFVNAVVYAELEHGDTVEFFIHHHIREDAQELYGFGGFAELTFFKLLIGVSGVGPKSALGVLAMAPVAEVKHAIAAGDASMLQKVSGIGKKTAERVVLELRSKIGHLSAGDGGAHAATTAGSSSDEIDALISLGYSVQQARAALQNVDSTLTDSGERIRAALKQL